MAKTKIATEERKQELQEARPVRMLSPFEEMERMFENVFPRGWMRPFAWDRPQWHELFEPMEVAFPKVDLIDRDDEILVRAEIPGVTKEDLEVSVTDDSVTIKATRRHEEKAEKGEFYRREISHGALARTLMLPATVDGTKAKARFQDGVLELTLTKLAKAKRHTVRVE